MTFDALINFFTLSLVAFIVATILNSVFRVLYPKIVGDDRGSRFLRYLPEITFFDVGRQGRVFANIFFYFTINRLIIVLVAALIFSLLEDKPLQFLASFDNIWFRWDTRHFLYIAEHGYPEDGEFKTLLVFYPMYPLAVSLVNFFVGHAFVSGVLISLVCLLFSCFFIFKLAEFEFGSEVVGKLAVKYMLLFPFSFFGSIVYTESMFLLFSICCFYYVRKNHWWLAGVFGCLAALTRNQGVLLFAPMMYEIFGFSIHKWRSGALSFKQIISMSVASLLIPLGFFLYLFLNYYVSGDPFKFLEYQRTNWGQEVIFFADNVVNIFNRINDGDWRFAVGTWIPSFLIFFFVLILLAVSTKVLPASYAIYGLALLVVSYSPSWLLSGARYMFVVFPVYLVLAKILEKRTTIAPQVDFALSGLSFLAILGFLKNVVY